MKAGINTLIAKIGIAAAIVAVIAVGAVFIIRNSGEEEASGRGTRDDAQEQTSGSEDAQGQTSGYESEGDAQGQASGSRAGDDAQGQASEFSGDWDMVEESGYRPFWLKYANLGVLEEEDLSNVMMFDKFAVGASLEEMISSYNYFGSRGNSLEEFKEWATTNTIGAKKSITISCYTAEDDYSDEMSFDIYNLTDFEVTVWECIENNQFYYESDYDGEGFEVFDVPHNSGDNREALTELVEILGKPSLVANCSNGALSYVDREEDEEFAETVSLGGGQLTYNLVYDRGNYMLQIGVIETSLGSISTKCQVRYFTRGIYEYGEMYRSSEIIIKDIYDFE